LRALLCIGVVMKLGVAPAMATPTVAGIALPSRGHDGDTERARRIADRLALALHGRVATADRSASDDLAIRLERARALYHKVDFDRSAAAFDDVLERAARAPHKVTEGSLLVAAAVTRATIAVARAETKRMRQLLERFLTYDPTFSLLAEERQATVGAELEKARLRLGARPALREDELADACGQAEILVVVRHSFGKEALIVTRLDACREALEIEVAPRTDDDTIATQLATAPWHESVFRAHDRYEIGLGLYKMGRYDEAIREWTAAYALSPRPPFLLNIGQAYRRLGRLDRAQEMYRTFLATDRQSEHAEEVKQILLTIEREIRAGAPVGAVPGAARVAHVAGEARALGPRSRRGLRIAGWTALAVGLGAVAAGGAFVGLAKQASDQSATLMTYDLELENRHDLYQRLDVAFFSVGAALSVGGVVMAVLGRHPREPERSR
jgi:tetratricopeptide (TPR) repeat protein